MLITRESTYSGQVRTVDLPVTPAQMDRLANRSANVQDIFPDLSTDQREFLLTGITAKEWAEMFPPEEDE